MNYHADLFDGRRERDSGTKYRYFSLGAFYDCHSDDGKEFYLSRKDQKSFLERVLLYRERVLKLSFYPIFSRRHGVRFVSPAHPTSIQQFLGLPKELFSNISNLFGEKLLDAVVSHVHFDDSLCKNYLPLENYDLERQLQEDEELGVECINFLLERGILLPHVDVVVQSNQPFFPLLPAFCDAKRVPPSFVKASSSLLLLLFGEELDFKERQDLENFRLLVDAMDLEEQFSFAYSPRTMPWDSNAAMQRVLREYYNGLIRKELNVFFRDVYHLSRAFPPTLLEEDSLSLFRSRRLLSVGWNFVMSAKVFLQEEERDGEVTFVEKSSPFSFSAADREGIRLAFLSVRSYLREKGAFVYPELFLRLMGLPYRALSFVSSFSFEEGTAEEFLSLLPFGSEDVLSDLPPFGIAAEKVLVLGAKDDPLFQRYLLVRKGVFLLFLRQGSEDLDYLLFLDGALSFLSELDWDKALLPYAKKIRVLLQGSFRRDFLPGSSPSPSASYRRAILSLLQGEESEQSFLEFRQPGNPVVERFHAFYVLLLLLSFLSRRLSSRRRQREGSPTWKEKHEEIRFLDGRSLFLSDHLLFTVEEGRLLLLEEDRKLLRLAEEIAQGEGDGRQGTFVEETTFFGWNVFAPARKVTTRFSSLLHLGLSDKVLAALDDDRPKWIGFSFFADERYRKAVALSPILSRISAYRKCLEDGMLTHGEDGQGVVLFHPRKVAQDIRPYLDPELSLMVAADLSCRVWNDRPTFALSDLDAVLKGPYLHLLGNCIYRLRLLSVQGKERDGYLNAYFDERRKLYVAPGLFFDAYSRSGKEGSFFLLEEDRPVFDAFREFSRLLWKDPSSFWQRLSCAFSFSLPLPVASQVLSGEDPFSFPFRKGRERDDSLSFESYFRVARTRSVPFESRPFYRSLLLDGIFPLRRGDLISWKRSDFEAAGRDEETFLRRFDGTRFLLAEEIHGLAKSFLSPSPVLFSELLSRFVQEYRSFHPEDDRLVLALPLFAEVRRRRPDFLERIFRRKEGFEARLRRNERLLSALASKKDIRRFTVLETLFASFVLTEYFSRTWQRILVEDEDL